MTKYLVAAALLVITGLSFVLWWQSRNLASLEIENARYVRNEATLNSQLDYAKLSASVASARAKLATEQTAEATASIETIRNLNLGACADEKFDSGLADAIRPRGLWHHN